MTAAFHLRASLFVLAVTLAPFAPAQAQGIFDLPPLVQPGTQPAQSQQAQPQQTTPAAPAADPALLNFTVSEDLRAQHQKQFLDGIRANSPAAADDLAGQDLVGLMATALQPHGLKVDNVADAFTAWLMINHGLVTGNDADPTPAQVAGTRQLATTALLASPDLPKASDADKQNMAEVLLLQAMLNQMMVDSLKQVKPDGVPAALEEIRKSTRDMGLDLDRLELTANGLAPKPQ